MGSAPIYAGTHRGDARPSEARRRHPLLRRLQRRYPHRRCGQEWPARGGRGALLPSAPAVDMRLISPIISLDVEIERVETHGRTIVLSGFAGVHDMEAHVDAAEAWQLCR